MKKKIAHRERREAGVALIIVLGFLGLLLVMGMAFMTNARTERIVSDYSLEAIRSRQLMRTALAAAENDYSRELWDDKMYMPIGQDMTVFTSMAQDGEGVPSSGVWKKKLGESQVSLLVGEASDWVPAKYHTQMVTNLVSNANWITVRELDGDKRIIGRYAYVCFDTSGRLDANFIAMEEGVGKQDARDTTNRMRHSIREVPMGLLPETADASEFSSQRRGWKGFDSLQSLIHLTDGAPNDGTDNKSAGSLRWRDARKEYGVGLFSNLVSDLTCYGLSAYRGGRYDRGSGTWTKPKFIDPQTGDGAREAMSSLGGIQVDAGVFDKQMKDFISKSPIPQGVDYPSVKNVPMFNEIVVRGLKVTSTSAGVDQETGDDYYDYTAEVKLKVEFWYPFPSVHDKSTADYVMEMPTISLQSAASSSAGLQLRVGLVDSEGTIIPVLMDGDPTMSRQESHVEAKWNSGTPYTSEDYECTYTVKLRSATGQKVTDEKCNLLWIGGWTLNQPLVLKVDGSEVDKTPAGLGRELGNVTIEQGSQGGDYSIEAYDPRWNHMFGEWYEPNSDEGTIGELNSTLMQRNSTQVDDGLLMYCRNDALDSPADVGFFPANGPWTTIDIMSDKTTDFLALTTCDTNLDTVLKEKGVFYTNGTFNINSRSSNAVASVFYEMACTAIPGASVEDMQGWWGKDPMADNAGDHNNWVPEEIARGLAEKIMEYTQEKPCMAPMDWVGSKQVVSYLRAQHMDKHQRESFVRNTWGLFGVADNLFTAVLIAQSVKEGPGKVGTWDDEDQITGERRGVALVWRDPFHTGGNKHNEMMVRMFRFLND